MPDGNGNGNMTILKFLGMVLEKGGLNGLILIAFLWCGINSYNAMQARDVELVKSLNGAVEQNRKSLETIAGATAAMAQNTGNTERTLLSLDEEMAEFRLDVRRDHATTDDLVQQIKQDTITIIKNTNPGS